MKNKKMIKYFGLLSSICGLSILANSLICNFNNVQNSKTSINENNNFTSIKSKPNKIKSLVESKTIQISASAVIDGATSGELNITLTQSDKNTFSIDSVVEGAIISANNPKFIETYNYEDNNYSLTAINQYAFQNCSSLAGILTLPNSLTSIGYKAFKTCTNLTSINLSQCTNLSSIGQEAFAYNKNVSLISLPSSLKSIGVGAFHTQDYNEKTFNQIKIYLNWNEKDFQNPENLSIGFTSWPLDVTTDEDGIPTNIQFSKYLSFYVPTSLRNIYLKNKDILKWKVNYQELGLSWELNNNQVKEINQSNTNLPLILGLSLGLGIPILAGGITGVVIGIKKHHKPHKSHKK